MLNAMANKFKSEFCEINPHDDNKAFLTRIFTYIYEFVVEGKGVSGRVKITELNTNAATTRMRGGESLGNSCHRPAYHWMDSDEMKKWHDAIILADDAINAKMSPGGVITVDDKPIGREVVKSRLYMINRLGEYDRIRQLGNDIRGLAPRAPNAKVLTCGDDKCQFACLSVREMNDHEKDHDRLRRACDESGKLLVRHMTVFGLPATLC